MVCLEVLLYSSRNSHFPVIEWLHKQLNEDGTKPLPINGKRHNVPIIPFDKYATGSGSASAPASAIKPQSSLYSTSAIRQRIQQLKESGIPSSAKSPNFVSSIPRSLPTNKKTDASATEAPDRSAEATQAASVPSADPSKQFMRPPLKPVNASSGISPSANVRSSYFG